MDVTVVLRMMLNWKAPGRDQIANFWLQQLTEIHTYLATLFNKLIEVGQIPEWLITGVTILIPKNENTERPKNYRPITCLPTIYKTITSIITKWIQKITDVKNLMPKPWYYVCATVSDKAQVTRGVIINFHNQNLWAEDCHGIFPSCHKQQFSINIWTGIVGGCLFVP